MGWNLQAQQPLSFGTKPFNNASACQFDHRILRVIQGTRVQKSGNRPEESSRLKGCQAEGSGNK
ncbi:hypothetical protein SCA6_007493 [Theobroma cacao]